MAGTIITRDWDLGATLLGFHEISSSSGQKGATILALLVALNPLLLVAVLSQGSTASPTSWESLNKAKVLDDRVGLSRLIVLDSMEGFFAPWKLVLIR